VGGVLHVWLDGASSSVMSEGRVVQPETASAEEIARWTAAEAADVVLSERQALSRKNARGVEQPLEDALDVLRGAFDGLSGIGRRAAFLEWVSTAIQSGRTRS
jgi:hypothetical protein